MDELELKNKQLRKFARSALDYYWGLKKDDFCLEEEAVSLGIAEYIMVDKPCGNNCLCEHFDAEFPVECCRLKKN